MERIIREFQKQPILRVNVANSANMLDFSISERFSILNGNGKPVLENIFSPLKWRIKLESYEPAKFIYTIMVGAVRARRDAQKFVRTLKKSGYAARIRVIGGIILLGDMVLSDNTHYRILIGEYNTVEDARIFALRLQDKFKIEIIREKIREARGVLEVFDAEYNQAVHIENGLTLQPKNFNNETILYDTMVDSGFDWQKRTRRLFKGNICFRVGDHGGITAISEIPLENYLLGVLPAVMGPDYPMEALKCQAVASRCLAMANIGFSHPEEPFDVCIEMHCQLFGDMSQHSALTDRAVSLTHGEVLIYNRNLCETSFTSLCGGYTDNKYVPWADSSASYLHGIYDGVDGVLSRKDLQKEHLVAQWIVSQPDVFCKPNGRSRLLNNDHTRSAFRWEVTYTRKKLEEIILKKSGEDIGTLFDIIPVKRGLFGRLEEVEIIGSRKNVRIYNELRIRQVLSENTLNSSCFIIETNMGSDCVPLSFSFVGAGTGHGKGMCQAGAAALAMDGWSYKDILKHYYKNAKLEKKY